MYNDVVEARTLEGYRLYIRFEDGVAGVVDISKHIEFSGIFEPLSDRAYFEKVAIHPECGILCWPNGADICPDVLRCYVTGRPVEDLEREWETRAAATPVGEEA